MQNAKFFIGDCVWVHMPTVKSGPSYKLARPFRGPYDVKELFPNGAHIVPVQSPRSAGFRVALNRLRRCPEELSGSCDGHHGTPEALSGVTAPSGVTTLAEDGGGVLSDNMHSQRVIQNPTCSGTAANAGQPQTGGVWKNRLRSRGGGRGQPALRPGEM